MTNETEQVATQNGDVWVNGPAEGQCFVFAHGAGAGADSDFMTRVAQGLAAKGVRVVRFEFPYMQQRRSTQSKRPPDRAPKLLEHFDAILRELAEQHEALVIGGKSMGGRMASMLAAELNPADQLASKIKGVIAFGYPFHPPGKPEKLRVEHLPELSVPMLILQGERDKLGDHALVSGLAFPESLSVNWFEDGDHDLKPRKRSGYGHEDHLERAAVSAVEFIKQVSG